MLYQRPEIKASLEIIMSVFTVTILIFFAIRPTVTNIFALQKKIEDQIVLETKADNKIKQLLAAEKQINDFGDQLNLYEISVPTSYSYFDYAKRITILANENNIALERLTFPGGFMVGEKGTTGLDPERVRNFVTTDDTGLTTIKVGFTSVGSQGDTIAFLTAIENMDRLALIKSIDIVKVARSSIQTVSGLRTSGFIDFYTYQKP